MTQQFDLAFNTANTMDKMMNSSSSFMSKDNKSTAEFDSQFSNYLDNANKSFEKNDKPVVDNSKNDYKSTKSEEKTTTVEDNSTKYDYSETSEVTDTETQEVVTEEYQPVEKEEVLDEVAMDEMLQESILNANLTTTQTVSKEDVAKLEQALAMSKSDDSEISMDAIKSGVQFEEIVIDTEVKDLENVDIQIVDEAVKDVVASKEELINAMYNSKETDVKAVEAPVVKDVKPTETELPKVALPKDETPVVEKVETVKTEAVDAVQNEVKTEVEVKSEELPKTEMVKEVQPEMKTEADIEVATEEVKAETPVKVEVKQDLEVEPEIAETAVKVEDKKVEENVAVQKLQQPTEQVKEQVVQDVEVKVDAVQQTAAINAVKTENVKPKEEKIEPNKLETLNAEIKSAKLENAANLADKPEKTVADKNPKTNVVAEETMDVQDDVSGIEFKNQKPVAKAEDTKVPETHVEKISNKIENVKIHVEEDIKVAPQQQNMTDAAKVAKANETLEKAGLSTENLQKMDGKVKDLSFSSNQNSQTDLGQSSQEMMMRDMMQSTATSANQTQGETKVEFMQSLNKAAQANAQQAQAQQEAPDVDILEQIRTRINATGKGMQRITIGLTPESLGKLNIEISKGQNGISAQILADNPQAKEILEKNLDGLKSVLQSQGVNVNNVNVRVAEAGRSADSNNNMFQNENGQFDSNHKDGHSRDSEDSNKERRSDFEFIQNTVLKKDSADEPEDVISRVSQVEKTVSINGGLGKVNYKM